MKRTVKFKDKKGYLAVIDIKIKKGRLSMSGNYKNSAGQCNSYIKPKNDKQKELLEIWEQWHLNDMHAGTEKQEKALRLAKKEGTLKNPQYEESCAYLESIGLLVDNGYKYGSAWLTRKLPANIEQTINNLCDEIEKIEKEEIEKLPIITWENIEDGKIAALGQSLQITPQEAKEYITTDGSNYESNHYEYTGIYYFVGTEKEATDEAMNYLIQDDSLWKEAVATGDTTKGLYEWAKWVIDQDGLGHILNSWDGEEDWQEVNGTNYFICRR